ncbi:DEAD/DEAH box helicase family protein [Anaerococcus nagyae]|uniref:DEAD/DEAH box helicase family protein n=1 Tax=Anaerococcus nagyae TaxID=1755241 RepID=UPI003736BEA6
MTDRKGNQYPTQSVILPGADSLYEDAIELYEKTGRKAQGWQKSLLKAIMSTNKDGLWTHSKFGWAISRRNGKSEIALMRALWGLFNGEHVVYTAHRTQTSHRTWEKVGNFLDNIGVEYTQLKAIGRERLQLVDGDGIMEFRTRTSAGGLGEGFDLLIIDEAQEYTDDQETALKYVVTDSKNPQTLFMGTPPTAISAGTVFLKYRKAVLNYETEDNGWAEWSVEDMTDPHNVDAWYATNPSLGTIFTERAVKDEISSNDLDFNIQRLGLWLKYNQKSAISEAEWGELKVRRVPALTGKLSVGIKYGRDGANAAMSIAVKTKSGKVFVESIDCQSTRNGNGWILNFLSRADIADIVIDGAGAQELLKNDIEDAKIEPSPILPTVKEVIVANSDFKRGIDQMTIVHKDQPSLTQVITNCEKRSIGSQGGFGYKAQYDDNEIALMDSIILAHWACNLSKPEIKQTIRY